MGLIAVGDVHGCSRTLQALMGRLEPTPDDHLVFVGDYIDRGPDSRGVLEYLIALKRRHTCTFLRGNHEALMIEYLDRGESELWRINGGSDTLRSYADAYGRPRIPKEHVSFVRETRLYLETDSYFFVHGGIPPQLPIKEAVRALDEETFLWERSHLSAAGRRWEKTVVCGHTPMSEPIVEDDLIAIDTGCVYYGRPGLGRLTAVRLPELEFTFAPYAEDDAGDEF